ncbi:non-homologous end joining protein Ku [Hyphococcus sp.]|uniref:non-homologous end joining protein Ku n=1 Tax=Hyphococcus sp. TaxID=2038636 RepID=UPI0035C6FA13
MAARAYWKGHLRLSLVSIGIELYSAATSSRRLALHQIHKPSGKRIRYQKTAPGVGPVDKDEIVKGFEVGKDEYVILEPDELDEIKLESKHTIDLVQFVDQCEIDPRYFEKPYYVVPEDSDVAEEGFAVIRDALREAGKTGLGQMAVRGRDSIVAIRPCGEGLLLETLRYAEEIRESDAIFEDIPEVDPDEEMLDLALELIERKSAPFEADAFKSQYSSAMRELIEQKRKKGKVTAASDEEIADGDNVIDLMDALKKSVSKDKKKSSSRRKSSSSKKNAKKRKAS